MSKAKRTSRQPARGGPRKPLPPARRWRVRRDWLALAVVAGIAGAVAVVAFFVAGTDGATFKSNPVAATDDSVTAGATLYQNNCLLCHGPQGRGGALAADLRVHVAARIDGFLFDRISNGFLATPGQNSMPAFKDQLSETERWHLVNFLRTAFGKITPVLPKDIAQ